MSTVEFLQGELERLFELDKMMTLSAELLGFDPKEIGGTAAKGTFARALARHCEAHEGLAALEDAIRFSAKNGTLPAAPKAPEDADLVPGALVGGFKVLKRIASGPLGVVYLAERPAPSNGHTERAALKVFARAATRDRAATLRLLTAARALKQVQDIGIAGIYEAGTLDDGRVFVASEYIPGQSLANRLSRSGAVHITEVRAIARTLLKGLYALHKRGFLHGHLKLENVFVVRQSGGESGRSEPFGVLTDLGTGRLLCGGEALPPFVLRLAGDPACMAPEVARGAEPDVRSEIYAVGTMLYHALSGQPLYEAKTPIDLITAHLYEEPAPLSERAPRGWVSTELERVIERALSKEPSERYETARDFADALEAEIGRSLLPPAEVPQLDMQGLLNSIAAFQANPSDEALAAQLEALVAPTNSWHHVVDVFLEAADAVDHGPTKEQLLFRTARVLSDEQKDVEAAERVYRVVLEYDPENAQAHNAIEELRRHSNDHEGLVGLLLDRLESETDRGTRAAILREVAGLYEEELDAEENAFVAWCQALSEEPEDDRAVRAVERLAKTAEQWLEAIESVQDTIENPERPEDALALCLVVTRWYERRLSRPDLALPYLTRALQIDPAHEGALTALTNLYREAQSWTELVQLLVHRSESASPARARDLQAEAASVLHRHVGDTHSAAQLFEGVLADDPSHPGALEALEDIYLDEGALDKLGELLTKKAQEQRGAERAHTLCELALLHEEGLEDLDGAIAHYNSALSVDDKNLIALKGLERAHLQQESWEPLLTVLEKQLALVATPAQRIELLERIAPLHEERLSNPALAAETYEKIIELAPSHEGANTALARLYRELHRFDALAQTFDRHAKGVEDTTRKAELLMQAARVLMADLGSPERAAFVCERVLTTVPGHSEALALTARIRALAGDSVAALDALEVLADTEQDALKRAELWVRAGELLEQLDNFDDAVDRYTLALEADPRHALALEALGRLCERRGDTRGQADLLLRKVEFAEGPEARAAALVTLGKFRLDVLSDKALAADAFERARELNPDNLEALLGLGHLALERESFQEAAELLEPVLDRTTELPREISLQACLAAGDAYRATEQLPQAERAYLQAKAVAPDDKRVLERLAAHSIATDNHHEAAQLLGKILDRFASSLSPTERGEILLKLGRAKKHLGDLTAAALSFSQSSELLLEAPEPLDELYDVQIHKRGWDAAARTLRRRIDLAEDDDQLFDLWVRAGDLYATHMRDRDKAAKAYLTALELNAADRNLLSKLMALYSEAKDWTRLLEVLVRMAGVVEDPTLRGKYFHTAAAVAHQELGAYDQAIEFYEKALASVPSLENAFRGLTDCLQRSNNWERLARAYRTHIERIQGQLPAEQLAALWHNLAELYHARLNRIDEAVAAYEAAQELDPDNRPRMERLVEIYGKHPNRYAEQAVSAHAALLEQQPYRIESYRGLRKLYTQLSRPDEAWAVCQALRSLNMAEPDEEAFFKRYRVQAPATARECITEQIWDEYILSTDQDPLLTSIFAMLQPAAIHELAQEPEVFGIDRHAPVDCQNDGSVTAQMLFYASGVTLVPLPPTFYQPGAAGGVSFLFTNPPSLGLGQAAFQGAPDQAVAFIAGRQLSYMRPGHYMRQLVPSGSGLRSWLLAAIRLANPRFPVPDAMRAQVERNHQALVSTLHSPAQQSLRSLVEQLLREQPELDMKRWGMAIDIAADRVGFILANSLDAAVAVIRASPPDSSYASERDRLKELYLYAVSPRYLALRHAIGVTIT